MTHYICEKCDPPGQSHLPSGLAACAACDSDGTEILSERPGGYEVRTSTIAEGWVNCWHLGESLQTFTSISEAQAEIDAHIKDLALMRTEAGEEFDDLDDRHEREQLRIHRVDTGEPVG